MMFPLPYRPIFHLSIPFLTADGHVNSSQYKFFKACLYVNKFLGRTFLSLCFIFKLVAEGRRKSFRITKSPSAVIEALPLSSAKSWLSRDEYSALPLLVQTVIQFFFFFLILSSCSSDEYDLISKECMMNTLLLLPPKM